MNLKESFHNLYTRYKLLMEGGDKVSLLLRNVYPQARKLKYCLDKIGVPQDDQELRRLYISHDDMELARSIHWDIILGLKLYPKDEISKHSEVIQDRLLDLAMFGILKK